MLKPIVLTVIFVILKGIVYFYTDLQGRGVATAVGTDRVGPRTGSGVNDTASQGGLGGPQCSNLPCCAPKQPASKACCCP